MNIDTFNIEGLILTEPDVYGDNRGYFFESYNQEKYAEISGELFVQDNESFSTRGVLRGLHLQLPPYEQGKLVRVITGEVLDVAVDVRPESATFGQYIAVKLSGENKKQFWVPKGFAHGFLTLSETALLAYKCSAPYHKESEFNLKWDDPELGISWGTSSPELSDKDRLGESLAALKERLTNLR